MLFYYSVSIKLHLYLQYCSFIWYFMNCQWNFLICAWKVREIGCVVLGESCRNIRFMMSVLPDTQFYVIYSATLHGLNVLVLTILWKFGEKGYYFKMNYPRNWISLKLRSQLLEAIFTNIGTAHVFLFMNYHEKHLSPLYDNFMHLGSFFFI